LARSGPITLKLLLAQARQRVGFLSVSENHDEKFTTGTRPSTRPCPAVIERWLGTDEVEHAHDALRSFGRAPLGSPSRDTRPDTTEWKSGTRTVHGDVQPQPVECPSTSRHRRGMGFRDSSQTSSICRHGFREGATGPRPRCHPLPTGVLTTSTSAHKGATMHRVRVQRRSSARLACVPPEGVSEPQFGRARPYDNLQEANPSLSPAALHRYTSTAWDPRVAVIGAPNGRLSQSNCFSGNSGESFQTHRNREGGIAESSSSPDSLCSASTSLPESRGWGHGRPSRVAEGHAAVTVAIGTRGDASGSFGIRRARWLRRSTQRGDRYSPSARHVLMAGIGVSDGRLPLPSRA